MEDAIVDVLDLYEPQLSDDTVDGFICTLECIARSSGIPWRVPCEAVDVDDMAARICSSALSSCGVSLSEEDYE